MKIPTDIDVSSFIQRIKEKVLGLGGRPEDLTYFFGAPEHRYYDEAADIISSRVVWLTPKTKPKGKTFEVEVNYNPYRLPEKIDARNGTTIYCRKPKYLSDMEMDTNCTRVECIQFLSDREDGGYPKNIRDNARKKGLKAGTLLHAFAIKELAEKDPIFKKSLLPFLPIYFLGARYTTERMLHSQKICRENMYIGLNLNNADRFHAGRQEPRVENPPIIWDGQSARGYLHSDHYAFY